MKGGTRGAEGAGGDSGLWGVPPRLVPPPDFPGHSPLFFHPARHRFQRRRRRPRRVRPAPGSPTPVEDAQVQRRTEQCPLGAHVVQAPHRPAPEAFVLFDLPQAQFDDFLPPAPAALSWSNCCPRGQVTVWVLAAWTKCCAAQGGRPPVPVGMTKPSAGRSGGSTNSRKNRTGWPAGTQSSSAGGKRNFGP